MYIDKLLKQNLEKEIPIHNAEIRALYDSLDKISGLNSSNIPISYGYESDSLGSYTQASEQTEEHFHFSLLFIGYCVKNPLQKSDRLDLYKHEYAHFMQYNMAIPAKYQFKAGTHGSAWQYCCSLVGAAPTPYYKMGEGLLKHDYDKALRNPINDKTVTIRDNYRREQEYQNNKNRVVQYSINDTVNHPKFGEGIIEEIEQLQGSVRLHIRFKDQLRIIDQKWLLKTRYSKTSQ